MTAAVRLGANQYGKAEVRIVKVTRDHAGARDRGSQRHVAAPGRLLRDAPDGRQRARRGHRYAEEHDLRFAREHGIGSPEEFLLVLGRHFTGAFDWVDRRPLGRRRRTSGTASASTARRTTTRSSAAGQETRTAVARLGRRRTALTGGLKDLTVLKSTGSRSSTGFPRDRYTTLTRPATASWRRRSPAAWHLLDRWSRSTTTRSTPRPRGCCCQTFADDALARAPADPLRDGRRVLEARPRDRRGPLLDAQQAPLPRRPRRSGSTTPARSSTPPTGRTA